MTDTEKAVLAGAAFLLLHKRKSSAGSSSTAPSSTLYIVQSGDSLSLISQSQYGDLQLWPLLYDANQATIGPDYNLIQAGQVLTIPALSSYSQAQIDDAHSRAANWQPSSTAQSTVSTIENAFTPSGSNYSNPDGTASVEGL